MSPQTSYIEEGLTRDIVADEQTPTHLILINPLQRSTRPTTPHLSVLSTLMSVHLTSTPRVKMDHSISYPSTRTMNVRPTRHPVNHTTQLPTRPRTLPRPRAISPKSPTTRIKTMHHHTKDLHLSKLIRTQHQPHSVHHPTVPKSPSSNTL